MIFYLKTKEKSLTLSAILLSRYPTLLLSEMSSSSISSSSSSSSSSVEYPVFNILIVGDAGVGKSAFINRHKTGEFEKNYRSIGFIFY